MERKIKYPQLGANLRQLRVSTKHTQQTLSNELGVNRNSYSMWESGYSRPNPIDEKKIAAFYNTNVDALYNTDIQEPPAKPAPDTKKPDAEIATDSAMPGIYQSILTELIETSKAQRKTGDALIDLSKAQIKISEALLEERTLIRDTANAAIQLASQAPAGDYVTKQDLESSLVMVNQSLRANQTALRSLERLVVNHGGKMAGKTPEQIEGFLHGSHEKPSGGGSKSGKIRQVDN